MSSHFIEFLLIFCSLNSILFAKYHYITNDGTIHSTESDPHELWTTGINKSTVAVISYENNVNKTGWANLELKTFDHSSDDVQSYMAGCLEGYITGELIEMSYKTTLEGKCVANKTLCETLKAFVENNTLFVERMIAENQDSDYWHQIHLIYEQLRGLEDGYRLWKVHNHRNRTPENEYFGEVFLLNMYFELVQSLQYILVPDSASDAGAVVSDHCSALVKPLADGSDLFVAHNTWTSYYLMLRVVKKYIFAFNTITSNNTERIAGHSVAFSSYPGFVFSGDDYYVLSSGLVVQETTNHNYNQSLFADIRAEDIVFEFVRNVLANRLAHSGKEWTQLFGRHNSGTYNNQFMIVDYKVFKKGAKVSELSDHLLWIIEQMPLYLRAEDVTHVLREQGYWASYNVPYFDEVFKMSGNEDRAVQLGAFYKHNESSRARIFRRDHSKVTDLKTLYSLMRYNDYKNDPLSRCLAYNHTCSPPYSADLAIASRNDLNDPKGVYPIDLWMYRGVGAIDAKMTDSAMARNLEMLAVSGPTATQQPPFQWSTSGFDFKHFGQPDVFDFKPIHVQWFPNSYEFAKDICF